MEESLYTTGEHFKRYQREFPHHDLSEGFLMSTFYLRLNPTTRMLICALAGGDITLKTPIEVNIFIKTLVLNHHMGEHEVSSVQGVGT